MSYVRFGENDSSVYVYEHVDGWIECCGCSLSNECGKFYKSGACVAHLRRHIEAGDHVPDYVFDLVTTRPQR
jgi:hypothetical protein